LASVVVYDMMLYQYDAAGAIARVWRCSGAAAVLTPQMGQTNIRALLLSRMPWKVLLRGTLHERSHDHQFF